MLKFFKLKKIDRYIIKKFLGTYVFMLLLIISIIVVFDINERLDRFISNNAPLNEIIFNYYLNFIPYFAHLLSPLFVFLAVIFFTSKMANDSEVIAILSNGINFKRLMKPYMIGAFIIATFWFTMGTLVIPRANEQRIEFELTYFNPGRRVIVDRNIQFRIGPTTIVYFGNFNLENNVGNNFAMDEFDGLSLVSRLTANRITYDSLFNWTIHDVQIRRFDGMIETIETRARIDTTLNIVPNDFIAAYTGHETMTSPQLRRHISNRRERGLGQTQAFEIEYHNRIAGAFSAFILTLIGAALSARKVKGGMGVNIGLGLALSMTYILFMTISTSFAVQGGAKPMLAAWIPNIIFAFVAWILAKRAPS